MDADIGVGLCGETRPCCCQRHSAIISGIHTPTTQLVEAAEERRWTRILVLGCVGKPDLAVVSVIPRSSAAYTPRLRNWLKPQKNADGRGYLLGCVGKPDLAVVSVIPRSSAAYTPRLRNWLKPQKNADGRGYWCWVVWGNQALLLSALFRVHQRHTHPDYAIG